MANSEPVLKGSCQCGNVEYSSTRLPVELSNCHCLACRKITGAAFWTACKFPLSAVTWLSRDSLVEKRYSDVATRTHCSACGSTISMKFDAHDTISISASSIDEATIKGQLPKAKKHIFVGEKASWYDLPSDGLGKFEKFPPRSHL
ncbi:glutathione-dependent formaldehyde-activating enzyme [Phlyctema vagabunda]|uniref:Glutathione-dependent formaldehyde-activating enzyme n=1 Tax=Phlyctema vagabunda TaxID=108571 RepID=A0ABR4PHH4_9HELO